MTPAVTPELPGETPDNLGDKKTDKCREWVTICYGRQRAGEMAPDSGSTAQKAVSHDTNRVSDFHGLAGSGQRQLVARSHFGERESTRQRRDRNVYQSK